ncbi:MAG: rhodanese-like domain-containing protein [Deltaproteobacteria bacterium]|nr:rhodanese-like domain-containing protein [Deltaproteobacteria bacterium]
MKLVRSLLLPIVAVSLAVGALWYTNRAVTPKEATLADVLAEAENGGYRIISNKALWERYRSTPDKIFLVDTRQEWEYRTGHIKGALNFPMEPTGWSRWRKQKPLETFLGPDKSRFIVFY